MQKYNLILILIVCLTAAYPVTSVSRWFSSTYQDLRHTLRRYGSCVGNLTPLKSHNMNESEFLIHQIREFLNQGSYDNEQLANVSLLMDNICRSDEQSYPISVHIDVKKLEGSVGKELRCQAIDDAMDPMFAVFKRASYNKSEPLDFSVIQFYPEPENKTKVYNLTDLINTSWIKSEIILENVCRITDSVKDYVQTRTKVLSPQDRSHQQQTGVFNNILDILDRILDPILGLQRRFYWEGSNLIQRTGFGVRSAAVSFWNRLTFASNSTHSSNLTADGRSGVQSTNQPIPELLNKTAANSYSRT